MPCTKSWLCVSPVVAGLSIICATIGLALFTLHVHKSTSYLDMPGDIRQITPGKRSIFCSAHRIQITLVDGSKEKIRNGPYQDSNTLPEADVYSFANHSTVIPLIPFHQSLEGSGLVLAPGSYEYHGFQLNADADVQVTICARYSRSTQAHLPTSNSSVQSSRGMYAYLLQGRQILNEFKSRIHEHPNLLPDTGKRVIKYIRVPVSEHCYASGYKREGSTRFLASINQSGEHYFFYFSPDAGQPGLVSRIRYDLNRTDYDLSAYKPTQTAVSRYRMTNNDSILLHFRYLQNVTGFHLYNIRTTFLCEANVITYIGFFFFVPLAVITVLVTVALCIRQRRNDRPFIDDNYGYSSYEPIYT